MSSGGKCDVCKTVEHPPDWPVKAGTPVLIIDGPYKNRIGIALQWSRYAGPIYFRVLLGKDEDGFPLRENFRPCQIEALQI